MFEDLLLLRCAAVEVADKHLPLPVVAAVGRVPAAVVDVIVLVLDGKVEAEHCAGGPASAQVQGGAWEYLSICTKTKNF